jgi:phage-related protein
VFNIVSEFPIVFNCRPFKYAVDNSVVTMAAAVMICIYNKKTTKGNFNNNGLAVLNECTKCEVTEELNGDYSLYIEYPVYSKKAGYFDKYNIIKTDDGQLFRIYKYEKYDQSKIIMVWALHIQHQDQQLYM